MLTGQEQAENKTQSRFRLLPFEQIGSKSGTVSASLTDEEGKKIELHGGNKVGKQGENYALRSFKSTPNFIASLTDVSLKVLESQDKAQSLMDGLAEINKNLPSSVYIPFVNKAWRNYCVLNIAETESRLFLTKTKAPFLVCIEVYRPEEILITSQNRYQTLLANTE